MNTGTLLFALMPGPVGMAIILVLAVLLFGKRLPEVGRSLGRGLMEFKKGLRGIEEELHSVIDSATPDLSSTPSGRASRQGMDTKSTEDHDEATAPKFEAPPAEAPPAEPASDAQPHAAPSSPVGGQGPTP